MSDGYLRRGDRDDADYSIVAQLRDAPTDGALADVQAPGGLGVAYARPPVGSRDDGPSTSSMMARYR